MRDSLLRQCSKCVGNPLKLKIEIEALAFFTVCCHANEPYAVPHFGNEHLLVIYCRFPGLQQMRFKTDCAHD